MIKVFVVGRNNGYSDFINFEHRLVDSYAAADVVILTGGEDVSPEYYGEEKGMFTYSNPERDKNEFAIIHRCIELKKLLVGICRGAQILTVASDGALVQHVSGHASSGTHDIKILSEGRTLQITSTHHQMMYPFRLDKNDYTIIAAAVPGLSNVYLNGNDKEIKKSGNFVEPEIVYYRKTNALAIQGHPEMMGHEYKVVQFINNLILELLDDNILSDKESDTMARNEELLLSMRAKIPNYRVHANDVVNQGIQWEDGAANVDVAEAARRGRLRNELERIRAQINNEINERNINLNDVEREQRELNDEDLDFF